MMYKLTLISIVLLLSTGTAQEAILDPVAEFIRSQPAIAIDMSEVHPQTKFSLKEKTHIILAKKRK